MNSFRVKLALLILMVVAFYQLACWTVAGVRSRLRRSNGPSLATWLLQATGITALFEFIAQASEETAFLHCAFSMLALMAKADGRVSEAEIARLEAYIHDTLKLDDERRKKAITFFHHALKSDLKFEYYLSQFYERFYTNPALLHGMASLLSELAQADGTLSSEEERLLNEAINTFGFTRERFFFHQRRSANASEERAGFQRPMTSSEDPLASAYRILGCSPDASTEAVKRSYRKLAKEHHPDRVVARGLPPEFVHHAEERFKEIQRAYDEVMHARGV